MEEHQRNIGIALKVVGSDKTQRILRNRLSKIFANSESLSGIRTRPYGVQHIASRRGRSSRGLGCNTARSGYGGVARAEFGVRAELTGDNSCNVDLAAVVLLLMIHPVAAPLLKATSWDERNSGSMASKVMGAGTDDADGGHGEDDSEAVVTGVAWVINVDALVGVTGPMVDISAIEGKAARFAGLGNTHPAEKEDIRNGGKHDGIDQRIIREIAGSTVHGRGEGSARFSR
ncbi:hypothetical protein IW261DRAFT_1597419 [Armillaria novae-zelandiae]|uniref:Uncharacterized protein n=1 Tax=Armillaria novae-zelandiae TaxID=153914 RepID=A0AA39NSS2_9AGAR|nr:hypothetical protein IW261DRAFT_1597419 [Armillaria novae-zelandiae]